MEDKRQTLMSFINIVFCSALIIIQATIISSLLLRLYLTLSHHYTVSGKAATFLSCFLIDFFIVLVLLET